MTEIEQQLNERVSNLERMVVKLFDMVSGTVSTNVPVLPCKYTLYEWLDEWYTVYKKPKLKESSLYQLQNCIEKHIKGNLQNCPLNALTAFDVQRATNAITTTRIRKYAYDTLCASLRQAYKLKLIPENIADMTENVVHKREQGKALTIGEQAKFIRAIKGNQLESLYMFYLLSGVRKSEALTLKWIDVDFAAGTVYISGTKTDNAKRVIPLFPDLEKLLNTLSRRKTFIFPFTANAVACNFKRLKKKHKFNFRIHDLRHTFATRCLESGIAMNVVQKWLGHAQASTTANIYTHVQTEFEKEEVTRFNPKLGRYHNG